MTSRLKGWVILTRKLVGDFARKLKGVYPQVFEFQIGGYTGTSHKLLLNGNNDLEYSRAFVEYRWGEAVRLTPTKWQWIHFVQDMDKIAAWNWDEYYATTGIQDGTYWSLKYSSKGQKAASSGKNAYPGGSGSDYAKDSAFGQLLCAIQKLTGIDDIR